MAVQAQTMRSAGRLSLATASSFCSSSSGDSGFRFPVAYSVKAVVPPTELRRGDHVLDDDVAVLLVEVPLLGGEHSIDAVEGEAYNLFELTELIIGAATAAPSAGADDDLVAALVFGRVGDTAEEHGHQTEQKDDAGKELISIVNNSFRLHVASKL
ncbi:hypothetical protein TYRP_016740 [Tyrophagus putrescentiae]|nr:hypothetical protein TYRP_016740 [Tyrophagus putrescentiae]